MNLTDIFIFLSKAVSSSAGFAIPVAFLWGVLSILLSPCHLSSIPLIMAYISGQKQTTTKAAFHISLLFGIGILLTVAVLGFVTAMLGRIMGDIGPWGQTIVNILLAIIFLVIGLYFLNIISLPFDAFFNNPKRGNRKWLTALLLGLIFGASVGPCTFAYMAPLLGVVFQTAGSHLARSLILVGAFAIGHAGIIVLLGTFTPLVKAILKWETKSKFANIVKTAIGILFILISVYFIYRIF
jgi:cytochrome c-type biogenesis protein